MQPRHPTAFNQNDNNKDVLQNLFALCILLHTFSERVFVLDFLELAKKRKSVRGFNDREIPEEVVADLLEAATEAPSGGNCQPWHFFVIRDKTVISKIVEESCRQTFILSAQIVIVVCTDVSRNTRYGERGKDLYSLQDTAAAVQNMLLCAAELGIGSCWCGAFDEDALKKVLKLSSLRPVALIPFGYFDGDLPKAQRRPLMESVTYLY